MIGELHNGKKKLIIFQSPADMAEGLTLINSIESSTIEVAVIGSVGLYNSITSFHPNAIFISPPAVSKGLFKYIFYFYLKRKETIDFIKSYNEIIYPDLLNDVFTSVLIKLAKDNNIKISQYTTRYNVILNNYDNTRIAKVILIKIKIVSFLLNLITGMNDFKMVKYNDRYIPYFTIKPDKFYKIESKSIQKKRIKFDLKLEKSINFLFLDPGPGIRLLINYYEVINDVLGTLCESGNLFIKKHPTHPMSLESIFLKNINFNLFEENLPLSMLELREFTHVIAIDSIGLSEVDSCIPISVIKLFNTKNDNYLDTYIKYLDRNSIRDIIFPEDISALRQIFLNNK